MVHKALADADPEKKYIVHSLILFCKRSFPKFEPMTFRLHGNNFIVALRLPFIDLANAMLILLLIDLCALPNTIITAAIMVLTT